MRHLTAIVFAVLLLMVSMLFVPPAAAASAQSAASGGPIVATLTGDTLVANSTTHEYVLTAAGGPVNGGNYSFTAFVTEKNSSGLAVSPTTGTSAFGIFHINVTAGSAAGIVTLTVNITAGSGSQQIYSIKNFLITVVDPVVLHVQVTNDGSAGVQNANVSLYIDNQFIQSSNVTLAAGQTTTVTFYWVAYHYPAGKNLATVSVSSNGQLLFSNGETQTSFPVYIPGSAESTVDGYIIVGCVIAAAVLFMIYFRKPKPRF